MLNREGKGQTVRHARMRCLDESCHVRSAYTPQRADGEQREALPSAMIIVVVSRPAPT